MTMITKSLNTIDSSEIGRNPCIRKVMQADRRKYVTKIGIITQKIYEVNLPARWITRFLGKFPKGKEIYLLFGEDQSNKPIIMIYPKE